MPTEQSAGLERPQHTRVLSALPEDHTLGSSQLSVILAPGDLTPSSGLKRQTFRQTNQKKERRPKLINLEIKGKPLKLTPMKFRRSLALT